MKQLTFSKVKRAHGLLRFLWPVQSFTQVKAMALIYAVCLPLMALVLHRNDPQDRLWDTLLAAAICGTWALFICLPATLELSTRGEACQFVGEVSDLLRSLGYAEGERCGAGLHFPSRMDGWMHWFPHCLWWKEIEIDLYAQDHVITLRGPKIMLNIVKRRGERGTMQGAFRF